MQTIVHFKVLNLLHQPTSNAVKKCHKAHICDIDLTQFRPFGNTLGKAVSNYFVPFLHKSVFVLKNLEMVLQRDEKSVLICNILHKIEKFMLTSRMQTYVPLTKNKKCIPKNVKFKNRF